MVDVTEIRPDFQVIIDKLVWEVDAQEDTDAEQLIKALSPADKRLLLLTFFAWTVEIEEQDVNGWRESWLVRMWIFRLLPEPLPLTEADFLFYH